ncbi:MAG: (2Fe-2S)-binding protein, partial [Burkholderiales bacterium]
MAQFQRITGDARAAVYIEFEGQPLTVCTGDTVLTAILTNRTHVSEPESSGPARAGFCLMGACQECWVWLGPERRVRACSTLVADGM